MNILVFTQKIDKSDPVLGFMHNWIEKLSANFEKVNVICLGKGEYNLPENVNVYSLGKEEKNELRIMNYELCKRVNYIFKFYKLLWRISGKYDKVFVHMNQEYVLLGGVIWKLLGKKVFMWRNHPHGNFFTRVATALCEKVFFASPKSFTARYKRGVLMPVGIDTDKFFISNSQFSIRKNKILSLGRVSPIKNIDMIIEAVKKLEDRGIDFKLDIVGDPVNPEDGKYYESLKLKTIDLIQKGKVNFIQAVDQNGAVEMYNSHKIFINMTPSGSMDKTILEAASCGVIPIVKNDYFKKVFGDDAFAEDAEDLSKKIEHLLNVDEDDFLEKQKQLREYVLVNHSLGKLITKLTSEIKNV